MKQHKTAFLVDKEHCGTLTAFYKKKQGISKAVIQKGGDQVWCCFGCMKSFSREHYKDEHMRNHKGCKEKHIQFEEENKSIFYKDSHGKTVADIISLGEDIDSNPQMKELLEKLKSLEKENARLNTRVEFLSKRVTEFQTQQVELRNTQSAFQEIVDEDLPEQQRKAFKSILAKKNPEIFKSIYDEIAYEVSVDSESDDSSSESSYEDNEEEERQSFKDVVEDIQEAPKNPITNPAIPPLYTGRPQKQYKIYHHNSDVMFIDEDKVLYDKNWRGEYIRCGFISSSGKVEFD